MNRRPPFVIALFATVLAGIGCTDPTAAGHAAAGSWRPLVADDLSDTTLAGKNADRARVLESPGTWRSDIDRMLFTKASYENFVLDPEFKNSPGTNGGIILYCPDVANRVPDSVEVQIADDTDPKWSADPKTRCGAFYGRKAATKFLVKKTGRVEPLHRHLYRQNGGSGLERRSREPLRPRPIHRRQNESGRLQSARLAVQAARRPAATRPYRLPRQTRRRPGPVPQHSYPRSHPGRDPRRTGGSVNRRPPRPRRIPS